MRHSRIVIGACAAAVVAASVLPATAYPRPGATFRASVGPNGAQPDKDSGNSEVADANEVSMSPDGRFVAFSSNATNLVPHDTNGHTDVFVRDRALGQTQRVSVATGGAQGTPPPLWACIGAWAPAISADGRYVAFVSCLTNLVPGTTYLGTQVFVHDRATNTTTLVTVDRAGHPSTGFASTSTVTISANGQMVAYATSDGALLNNPDCPTAVAFSLLCGVNGVVVRDMKRQRNTTASVASDGSAANDWTRYPSISPDGRYVAFSSFADNLAPPAMNAPCLQAPLTSEGHRACPKVFLHDLVTGHTDVVSVGLHDESPDNGAGAIGLNYSPVVSAGGRYVLYVSEATNIVPAGSVNSGLFVRDMHTGRTQNVAVDSHGGIIGTTSYASISSDGRYVVWDSFNSGCPFGMSACTIPCNGVYTTGATPPVDRTQFVVYDRTTGRLDEYCKPHGAASTPGDRAKFPVISANGRFVAFASPEPDLVGGDSNKVDDVFVRDRGLDVGPGGVVGAGKLTVAGAPGFGTTGVLSGVALGVASGGAAAVGGDGALVGATLAYRAATADVFLRLAVRQLPPLGVASPALVYGVNLQVGGVPYQVRVAKTGPLAASYGLFRWSSSGGWVPVASLAGSYGTTGQEVVVALPLRALGVQAGGRLSGVQAFTAIGSFDGGLSQTVDELQLSR
jgi:Tol biopolymer transport system component